MTIEITKVYKKYEFIRETETKKYNTPEEAFEAFTKISGELIREVNKGKLLDYEVTLKK